MEFDTLARHGVDVVGVMGNNGIWALEKHPMEFLYGYSVVADLRPGTRYDEMVEALGGHGELVERPADLRPALERAFEAGRPALVNVLTDPAVAYPRAVEPRLSRASGRPSQMEAAHEGAASKVGPDRTGRGTCHEGAGSTVRTAGGADSMRLRPNL